MKNDFLVGMSARKLRKREKKEKDPKAQKRLLACIMIKEGKTMRYVANALNTPYDTLRKRIANIRKYGLGRIYDIKNKGAEPKLNEEQTEKLIKIIDEGPENHGYETGLWTVKRIAHHIEKIFKVTYTVRGLWSLLRRLGYRLIVPRPKLVKGAAPEEIAKYKRKVRREVKKWTEKGYTVLVMDEAHVVLGSVPKRGWFRTSKPVMFVDSQKGVRKRVSLIGAIGKDGIHHFEAYDTANWPNFEKFLRNLHKKFGKVLIYMDNAPYHGKARLRDMTQETRGEMQFRFTLPYTPELNPIETQWTPVKGALSIFVMSTAKQVINSINKGIRQGVIPIVKLHDYYLA